MFDIRLSDINRLCEEQNYIINREVEYAVYSAIKLKKPLLIDGVPGVGKTELAKVLSKIYNAELIRFNVMKGLLFLKCYMILTIQSKCCIKAF